MSDSPNPRDDLTISPFPLCVKDSNGAIQGTLFCTRRGRRYRIQGGNIDVLMATTNDSLPFVMDRKGRMKGGIVLVPTKAKEYVIKLVGEPTTSSKICELEGFFPVGFIEDSEFGRLWGEPRIEERNGKNVMVRFAKVYQTSPVTNAIRRFYRRMPRRILSTRIAKISKSTGSKILGHKPIVEYQDIIEKIKSQINGSSEVSRMSNSTGEWVEVKKGTGVLVKMGCHDVVVRKIRKKRDRRELFASRVKERLSEIAEKDTE